MPVRPSERRAAERAAQREEHAAQRDAERRPPGRPPTRAQAALFAVALASLLWAIARFGPVRSNDGPAAPVTVEASR
jgi:ferric-dicitrate binding protein FerR (iron transport regulator)